MANTSTSNVDLHYFLKAYCPGSDHANANGLSNQAWDEVKEDWETATEDSVEYLEEADHVVSAGHQDEGTALDMGLE